MPQSQTIDHAICASKLNGTMRTLSGKILDLRNPDSSMIDINDIASGLANNSHFAGQTPYFFSIAQHCIMVCDEYAKQNQNAPDTLKLLALLHDAAEAYIGDMIKPLKVFLPYFQQVENGIMMAVASKFGLPLDNCTSAIKPFDIWAQRIEYNAFYHNCHIVYMDPEQARREFLERFKRYNHAQ